MDIKRVRLALWLVAAVVAVPAPAARYDLEVDTAPLAGVSGVVAFDLIDGDGVINHRVTLSHFAGDAIPGPLAASGDAIGTPIPGPAVLGDGAFLSEFLQSLTFGSRLTWRLELTGTAAGSSIPDVFSVFLLDASLGPLFSTTEPLGGDALLSIELTGPDPTPRVFTTPVGVGATLRAVPVAVAAPTAGFLVGLGLLALWLGRLPGPGKSPLWGVVLLWTLADGAMAEDIGATLGVLPRAAGETKWIGAPAPPGCVIHSLSIPVGKTREVFMTTLRPAPAGGARYELSPEDPGVVRVVEPARGDPALIVVPEGQTRSPLVGLYGNAPGDTMLWVDGLTPGFEFFFTAVGPRSEDDEDARQPGAATP